MHIKKVPARCVARFFLGKIVKLVNAMTERDPFEGIPREGFLKITETKNKVISSEQKAALIRKGNQLFNEGKYDQAKRIFLSTGYSDGIIRMGDRYYEQNEPLEALRMYWLAPSPTKLQSMIEKFASVVKQWLLEDKGIGKNEERTNTGHETSRGIGSEA